jgi:hypothetical protein
LSKKARLTVAMLVTIVTIALAPAAQALTVATQLSGVGFQTGNNVSIPITAIVPIQSCNNNVALGVIAVSVDATTGSGCLQ